MVAEKNDEQGETLGPTMKRIVAALGSGKVAKVEIERDACGSAYLAERLILSAAAAAGIGNVQTKVNKKTVTGKIVEPKSAKSSNEN